MTTCPVCGREISKRVVEETGTLQRPRDHRAQERAAATVAARSAALTAARHGG